MTYLHFNDKTRFECYMNTPPKTEKNKIIFSYEQKSYTFYGIPWKDLMNLISNTQKIGFEVSRIYAGPEIKNICAWKRMHLLGLSTGLGCNVKWKTAYENNQLKIEFNFSY